MNEKYITETGKKHLLSLGFINQDSTGNFNYVALGVGDSSAAIDKTKDSFTEANGNQYAREMLKEETTNLDSTDQSLVMSATFDSTNFNPSEGVEIKEIGIVTQDVANNDDIWFAFLKVPEIRKTSNISLKYTIVVSIE